MPEFVDINGNVRKFDYTYEGQAKYEKAYQKDQESRMKATKAPQVSQNIQNKGDNLVKDMTQTWEAPGKMNTSEIAAWQDILYQLNIIKNKEDYKNGVWNEVTQHATEKMRLYQDEGISDMNIWRREHGLPDIDEKGKSIEDVLMDTMGDVGSTGPSPSTGFSKEQLEGMGAQTKKENKSY